ncbi:MULTISPECIES: tail protein X [Pontibacillus]|uniref:Tail protein X n=1 Tax=Pontibacillus chungwhensis TaxID=265426 RepID=A0ABY8V2C9_9BACI|nr:MULTISPECIES: tail protein X [Pontibacillus]MCD5324780.1 tail protein X [Pontibacillus sp. HN14]WIF98739.1 tail protein X [Pontibacillus chungwhensis]
MVYETLQGDTWDGIAYKFYKDETKMIELLRANPVHINTVIFSAGISLDIPAVEVKPKEEKPPWLR